MNNLVMQREAIIEIDGTQYEDCAANHRELVLHQNLVMKHQPNNDNDKNAVMILTSDNKELGFIPKGYASMYAPAIDSNKYSFTVEVVKTEYDSIRPVLIVKVISEYKGLSEQDIESGIADWVQRFADGYSAKRKEYIHFIKSENVDINYLVSVLNDARLLCNLCSFSAKIIDENNIKPNVNNFKPFTADEFIQSINEIKISVSENIEKYKRIYSESIDINDEEERHKVQNESREKTIKFRSVYEICQIYSKFIEEYIPVSLGDSNISTAPVEISESFDEPYDEKRDDDLSHSSTVDTVNISEEKKSELSEQFFADWLVLKGGVTHNTAKQYISNIHSIENMYSKLFGVKKPIIEAESKESAKEMIDSLIMRTEYIDANERRHNGFNAALSKFAQFAGFTFDDVQKDNNIPEISKSAAKSVVKNVDFTNPYEVMGHKPISLIFYDEKYYVHTWKEVYFSFLIKLYNDDLLRMILIRYIGKSLYGRCIDFADASLKSKLRSPMEISEDFYAESNLSSYDFIKRIDKLISDCDLDYSFVLIEYNGEELALENEDIIINDDVNAVLAEDNEDIGKSNDIDNFNNAPIAEKILEKEASPISDNPVTPITEHQEDIPEVIDTHFCPDLTEPFDLKAAIISVLSSEAPEIDKFRGYQNGTTAMALKIIIKTYYDKDVSMAEISKLLMTDNTFLSVGKGSFILNPVTAINPDISDKSTDIQTHSDSSFDNLGETDHHIVDEIPIPEHNSHNGDNIYLYDKIIEVIKKNKDNLQYEDGFGEYEVKNLLSNEGIKEISEDEIGRILSESPELTVNDDGYYFYNVQEPETGTAVTVSEEKLPEIASGDTIDIFEEDISEKQGETVPGKIVLNLNGKAIRAYDCSDALCKVCEFAIKVRPFIMARIAKSNIQYNGSNVFCRTPMPVNGYNKLSNGLQVLSVNDVKGLKTITEQIKSYCSIENMITIISK